MLVRRFIGVKELSEYLDISKNTVRSWVWQKQIPYCKIGRLVKFDLQEIEVWLKKKRVSVYRQADSSGKLRK